MHRKAGRPESPETEIDANGDTRVKFRKQGWSYWAWRGHKIHYIKAGLPANPPVVLIHGFGASAYHWRYVIPELAKSYYVHAVDLLGFGLSDKAHEDYNGFNIWAEQLHDYVNQMLEGRKAVFVGNSMGGYASLLTSSHFPTVSRGLVLVNGAGKFDEVQALVESTLSAANAESVKKAASEVHDAGSSTPQQLTQHSEEHGAKAETQGTHKVGIPARANGIYSAVQYLIQSAIRACIHVIFLAAKQPFTIKAMLRQIYVSPEKIDEDLVQSILIPAQDSKAADVFYRIFSSQGPSLSVLLPRLKSRVLILHGNADPWIPTASADKIQSLLPSVERVDILGGHCPHDDLPEHFMEPLKDWLQRLPA